MSEATQTLPSPEYICRNCGAIYQATAEDDHTLTRKCHKCEGTMDLIEP